jgi:hypothetical protein
LPLAVGIGVTLPFFGLLSVIGVLISLVAIRLREPSEFRSEPVFLMP